MENPNNEVSQNKAAATVLCVLLIGITILTVLLLRHLRQ